MRQTVSILLLIFSAFVSVMLVSTGIAVQEQQMTSVAILNSFNINSLEKLDQDYYLKVEAVFENRAYTGAVIALYNSEIVVPALSEATADILIPVNTTTLISAGWMLKPVNVTIRFSERILFAVFDKKVSLTVPCLFENVSEKQQGNSIEISFVPSSFTAGNIMDISINGFDYDLTLTSGTSATIKIPLTSPNASIGDSGNYLKISNLTYYFSQIGDL
ncbi:hypothetical protein [Thermoplasma sp.]|uniref:hypothetical protein n=1 Tax=Thermoplasma sp. TaxID=1973142 RepID=UPI00127CEE11|nr:hypothetical protein [Thermoplasma sp.]KAA8923094.1 MAG: hypothetical protein F6Q11_00965 [Thermoplasma sp.]